MANRLYILLFLFFYLFSHNLKGQALTTDQLIDFPLNTPEQIGEYLEKAGWKKNNIEFVPDSNFVRRSWELSVKSKGAKCYFLYYEFTKDTSENYIIYQFSDRDAFLNYKKELKTKGYKLVGSGKSKKKKKNENIHKENEDLFYSEKRKTLTVVKEAFYYGLFSFLIYSYKPGSVIAEHEMHPIKK